MKKFNYIYVILVFVVAFNLRLGISSVPPLQSLIQENLNISNFQISLLTGIPVVCMGVFAFFIGNVQAVLGRRKGIFYLLILMGLALLSRTVINNYILLILTTFVVGFAIALLGPLLSGFIKSEFPAYASIMIGVFTLGMGTGSLIVSKTAKQIAIFTNKWQYGLSIWGVISITACIIWYIFSPNEETNNKNSENQNIKIDFKDFSIWKMIIFFGLQSGIFYGFSTWLIAFLESKGVSSDIAITLFTFQSGVQMLLSFLIPVAMHKIGSTRSWGIFSVICIVLGTIMPLIVPMNIFWAIILIIVISIGLGGSFPIAMLFPLDYTDNSEEASIVTGVVQAFGYIIGGVFPVIFGLVVDKTNNYNNLFIIMFICSLVILFITIGKMNKKTIL